MHNTKLHKYVYKYYIIHTMYSSDSCTLHTWSIWSNRSDVGYIILNCMTII